MNEDTKDCWECRITSGGGLVIAGTYVFHQSTKFSKGFSRHAVSCIGCVVGIVGLLRLFALPPFRIRQLHEENKTDETEKNEYIIGKFSSKF